MCDVCLWILKHYIEIFHFVLEKGNSIELLSQNIETIAEVIYISAPFLVLLLISFKVLSQTLESDHISMSSLFGLEQSALLTARQVTQNYQEVYELNCKIEEDIRKRLEHSKSGTYQYLLFSLTPKGRIVDTLLRMNENEELNDFLIEAFPIQLNQYSEMIDESVRLLNECTIFNLAIDGFIHKILDGGNCFMEEEDEEEEDSTDDSVNPLSELEEEEHSTSDLSDEENTNESIDLNKEDQKTYFFEEELENDIPFEIESHDQNLLIDLLSEISNKLGYEREKVINAYIQWFTKPEFQVYNNLNVNTYETWTFIGRNKEFKLLSDIVLRYCCISATEASCERLFNDQRETLSGNRSRTCQKTESARLVYMNTNDKTVEKALEVEKI